MLFFDVGLPITGEPGESDRLGAMYHLRQGNVTWMDFSRTDSSLVDLLASVLAFLLPLGSPVLVGSMTHLFSSGEKVRVVDLYGPYLPIVIPLVAGAVAYIATEWVAERSWKKWGDGIPAPSVEDQRKYITGQLDSYVRHTSGGGSFRAYKTPYLNAVIVLAALLLIISSLVYLQMQLQTVFWLSVMQVASAICAFTVFYVLFGVIPRTFALLRIERSIRA